MTESTMQLKKTDHQDVAWHIATGAEGLFLWVHLVVEQLLLAVWNEHTVQASREKLNKIPTELDDYYEQLMSSVAKSYIDKVMMHRILLLALEKPDGFEMGAISFSWIDELEYPLGGLLDPDFPTVQYRVFYR